MRLAESGGLSDPAPAKIASAPPATLSIASATGNHARILLKELCSGLPPWRAAAPSRRCSTRLPAFGRAREEVARGHRHSTLASSGGDGRWDRGQSFDSTRSAMSTRTRRSVRTCALGEGDDVSSLHQTDASSLRGPPGSSAPVRRCGCGLLSRPCCSQAECHPDLAPLSRAVPAALLACGVNENGGQVP